MVKLEVIPNVFPLHACGYHPCGDWVKVSLLELNMMSTVRLQRAMKDAPPDGEDNDDPDWAIVDVWQLETMT